MKPSGSGSISRNNNYKTTPVFLMSGLPKKEPQWADEDDDEEQEAMLQRKTQLKNKAKQTNNPTIDGNSAKHRNEIKVISSTHAHSTKEEATSSRAAGFIYIGSANCSESAWGAAITKTGKLRMNNVELGIVFPFDKDGNGVGCSEGMKFQTPCVIPGRPYEATEEPWLMFMESQYSQRGLMS